MQFLTLDGVFLMKCDVCRMHTSVSQTAERCVILWEAQQGAPHKHPATQKHCDHVNIKTDRFKTIR